MDNKYIKMRKKSSELVAPRQFLIVSDEELRLFQAAEARAFRIVGIKPEEGLRKDPAVTRGFIKAMQERYTRKKEPKKEKKMLKKQKKIYKQNLNMVLIHKLLSENLTLASIMAIANVKRKDVALVQRRIREKGPLFVLAKGKTPRFNDSQAREAREVILREENLGLHAKDLREKVYEEV